MSELVAPRRFKAAFKWIAPWAVLLACQVPMAIAAAALLRAVAECRL